MSRNEDAKLDRRLAFEMVQVTEAAAIAAAALVGRGDEKAADAAAVEAMRRAFNSVDIEGRVVIGEGERDEAPMLYIGEEVGTGKGPAIDIALDPLEGTTIAAKAMQNALAVLAIAPRGGLLNAPDVYMEKIATGPGLPDGIVDLDLAPADNVRRLAEALGKPVEDVRVCVLDRHRHSDMIRELRGVGCAVILISDGDVAGVIATTDPATHIDLYMGTGGAPEGVLAAAALRCVGGQMQGRLIFRNDAERTRARQWGVDDLSAKYSVSDMASGDVMFVATGVTDGNLLSGVEIRGRQVMTETLVMHAGAGSVRRIRTALTAS